MPLIDSTHQYICVDGHERVADGMLLDGQFTDKTITSYLYEANIDI